MPTENTRRQRGRQKSRSQIPCPKTQPGLHQRIDKHSPRDVSHPRPKEKSQWTSQVPQRKDITSRNCQTKIPVLRRGRIHRRVHASRECKKSQSDYPAVQEKDVRQPGADAGTMHSSIREASCSRERRTSLIPLPLVQRGRPRKSPPGSSPGDSQVESRIGIDVESLVKQLVADESLPLMTKNYSGGKNPEPKRASKDTTAVPLTDGTQKLKREILSRLNSRGPPGDLAPSPPKSRSSISESSLSGPCSLRQQLATPVRPGSAPLSPTKSAATDKDAPGDVEKTAPEEHPTPKPPAMPQRTGHGCSLNPYAVLPDIKGKEIEGTKESVETLSEIKAMLNNTAASASAPELHRYPVVPPIASTVPKFTTTDDDGGSTYTTAPNSLTDLYSPDIIDINEVLPPSPMATNESSDDTLVNLTLDDNE